MRVQSCCNHIKANVENRFGAEAGRIFGAAAQRPTESEFYSKLARMSKRFVCSLFFHSSELIFFFAYFSLSNIEAFRYIAEIDPSQYARCYTNQTTGRTTSQLIESLWSALRPERLQPLTSMYLSVLRKFSKWSQKHRSVERTISLSSFVIFFISLGSCFNSKF